MLHENLPLLKTGGTVVSVYRRNFSPFFLFVSLACMNENWVVLKLAEFITQKLRSNDIYDVAALATSS